MKNVFLSVLVLFTSFSAANSQEFAEVDKSSLDIAYYPTRAAFKTFAKTDEEKMSLTPESSGCLLTSDGRWTDNFWRFGAF
jgi:hypothetical protein